jgi:hypothetical protein
MNNVKALAADFPLRNFMVIYHDHAFLICGKHRSFTPTDTLKMFSNLTDEVKSEFIIPLEPDGSILFKGTG